MIAEEIVQHLKGLVGSNVEVTIEIRAEFDEELPDNVIRNIT